MDKNSLGYAIHTDETGMKHYAPIDDIQQHNAACDWLIVAQKPIPRCECGATSVWRNDEYVVIHNAFDKREPFNFD